MDDRRDAEQRRARANPGPTADSDDEPDRRAARAEVAAVSTGSWEAMAPRLGLRLEVSTGPAGVPGRRAGGRLSLVLGPGVRAAVVADLPHAMLPISAGHASAWHRPDAEVVARARSNTRAAPRHVHRLAPGGGPIELTAVAGGWWTTGLVADLTDLVPAPAAGSGPVDGDNGTAGDTGWALLVAPTPTTLVVASGPAGTGPDQRRAVAHHLAALVEGPIRPVIRYHPGTNVDIFTIFGWWNPPQPSWPRSTDLPR